MYVYIYRWKTVPSRIQTKKIGLHHVKRPTRPTLRAPKDLLLLLVSTSLLVVSVSLLLVTSSDVPSVPSPSRSPQIGEHANFGECILSTDRAG